MKNVPTLQAVGRSWSWVMMMMALWLLGRGYLSLVFMQFFWCRYGDPKEIL